MHRPVAVLQDSLVGGCTGRKSRLESFAGANLTLTIEAMMGDRRALQVCRAPRCHALYTG